MDVVSPVVLLALVASASLAPETADMGEATPPDTPRETPGAELAPEEPVRAWWSPDPLEPVLRPYRSLQDALAEHNFDLTLGFTLVYQHASEGLTDTDRDWFTGSYDIEGYWTLLESDRLGSGSVGFLVEGGEIFDESDSFDLSANIGSLNAINTDADGHDIAVAELWYEQRFGDTLSVTAGKIDQSNYFDLNAVANDETVQFLSSPLVNNASIAFPDRGLGVNAWWTVSDQLYLAGGVSDALGDTRESGFDTVDEGELFAAVEIGAAPAWSFGAGTYRLTAWHTELDDTDGAGVAINLDQQLGAGSPLIAFARFGIADDGVWYIERSVSAGLGIADPFGRADDLLAFGWAWSEPSDGSIESEHLFEVFYRLQLTGTVGLTPDLQFIADPSDPDEDDPVIIAGIRLQATF